MQILNLRIELDKPQKEDRKMWGRQCDQIGDLLNFGQLFKACGNNYFAQIAHIFVKVSKSFIFLVKSFWATFIDIWRLFTGHTGGRELELSRVEWPEPESTTLLQ